jgi:plastocyanin domain-containing protein
MHTRKLLRAALAALVFAVPLWAGAGAEAGQARRGKARPAKVQTAAVALTENGYEPASLRLRRGVPARVTFVRRVSTGCAQEVVLPDYGVKRELPPDVPVTVEFTPATAGSFTFSCAMGMVRGALVVR